MASSQKKIIIGIILLIVFAGIGVSSYFLYKKYHKKKCQLKCENKTCGDDGCGGNCGTCKDNENCNNGICSACQPNCYNKNCGDDGCGGNCGFCEQNQTCGDNGICGICQPKCENKTCGDDSCGGNCGTCDSKHNCVNNNCVCIPDCKDKKCGDDGCGGSCGSCEGNDTYYKNNCVPSCTTYYHPTCMPDQNMLWYIQTGGSQTNNFTSRKSCLSDDSKCYQYKSQDDCEKDLETKIFQNNQNNKLDTKLPSCSNVLHTPKCQAGDDNKNTWYINTGTMDGNWNQQPDKFCVSDLNGGCRWFKSESDCNQNFSKYILTKM